MEKYQEKYIIDRAFDCKQHLKKNPLNIRTVYTEKNELEKNKEIFLEILGEKLIKRVTFLPNNL